MIGRDVDCSVKRRSFSAEKAPIAPDLAGSIGAGRLRSAHDFIGFAPRQPARHGPVPTTLGRGRRRRIHEILSPPVRVDVHAARLRAAPG